MHDASLRQCRILIVEDEYLLADEMALELVGRGATVLGPAATVASALMLLEGGGAPDAAVLDVNLGGESVYPVADRLRACGVPMVFMTGYDPMSLPGRFDHVPTCEKPLDMRSVTAALRRAIGA